MQPEFFVLLRKTSRTKKQTDTNIPACSFKLHDSIFPVSIKYLLHFLPRCHFVREKLRDIMSP